MKLTAYRLTVLVLTNALTGLVAFAFGGAYATRIMEKKSKPENSTAKDETGPSRMPNWQAPRGNCWRPDFGAMLRDDIRKMEP